MDLNQTGITVGALDSTTYSRYITGTLSAATFKAFKNYADQYPAIVNGDVDAIVGDAVQYLVWLKDNNSTCACEAKSFGDPYYFGTFTTNNYTLSGAFSLSRESVLSQSFIIVAIAMIVLMILQQ